MAPYFPAPRRSRHAGWHHLSAMVQPPQKFSNRLLSLTPRFIHHNSKLNEQLLGSTRTPFRTPFQKRHHPAAHIHSRPLAQWHHASSQPHHSGPALRLSQRISGQLPPHLPLHRKER